ncbi:hypothetical protein PMZ80_002012 [Knufia obscura]|uniref:Nuclear distribution protein RO10 n=2 Tax=Knufia TaxID=430999 RepID=A0AAN8EEL1_9EURO|nr:hypothetical protein PMZ80_002012 [Knufia obscura]KAK5953829.1 hypothetical protein OHC33_005099 [Knufia fluminis]
MATESSPTPAQPLQYPPTLQDEPLNPTLTALSTLSLLNLRLSRLEYLLTGKSDPHSQAHNETDRTTTADKDTTTPTIPTQLRTLESRLTHLKRLDGLPGSLVRMIDSLRREYPELFPSTSNSAHTSSHDLTPTPKHDLSHHATEVLSHSTLYTSTSSHLQTLQTLRIPPASQSANLLNAAPRLQQLRKRQEEVDSEIAELKGRSANVLEWWVKTGVVGMGELWEDWEGRVRDVEREVRRVERRRGEDT